VAGERHEKAQYGAGLWLAHGVVGGTLRGAHHRTGEPGRWHYWASNATAGGTRLLHVADRQALPPPLRRRIQAIIDRRFYQRKYAARKTPVAFSATLKNEVDLEHIREHLLAVLQETLQPAPSPYGCVNRESGLARWLSKGNGAVRCLPDPVWTEQIAHREPHVSGCFVATWTSQTPAPVRTDGE
jgi:hypothetical protein